jgi:hypothetical protein
MKDDLRSAIRRAYQEALACGSDAEEAFETALAVVDDAEPDLDDEAVRRIAAEALADVLPRSFLVPDAARALRP